MCTVLEGKNNSNKNKEVSQNCDEDFYVLKFPHKLWRIVNECTTGAIQWGIYGKTILIDYNLFQSQYLECEVPKFKTRNMTSFVRQLNMYGFKKMQTQVKSDSSRCCNIHEFFHNSFRYGRYDLLDSVKRRPTPVKSSRIIQSNIYHNQSRIEMCRATFARALERSKDRYLHEKSTLESHTNDGIPTNQKLCTEFGFRLIPLENSLKHLAFGTADKELTVEVDSSYQELINMNSDSVSEESESLSEYNHFISLEETQESQESGVDQNNYGDRTHIQHICRSNEENQIQYVQESIEDGRNFFLGFPLSEINQSYSLPNNHSVQVKKGFDGTNYVIDLTLGSLEDDQRQEHFATRTVDSQLYSNDICQETQETNPEGMRAIEAVTRKDLNIQEAQLQTISSGVGNGFYNTDPEK